MKYLAEMFRSAFRSMLLACCFACPVMIALSAAPLVAQEAATRSVEGKVVNKSGDGLKNATVYLKDEHTLGVRSYVAADDGSYRFTQLSQNDDYQIWAKVGEKKSSVKNISSFDTKKALNMTLEINTK